MFEFVSDVLFGLKDWFFWFFVGLKDSGSSALNVFLLSCVNRPAHWSWEPYTEETASINKNTAFIHFQFSSFSAVFASDALRTFIEFYNF